MNTSNFLSSFSYQTKAIIISKDALPFDLLARYSDKVSLPSKSLISCPLPLFIGKVSAGFPSPADDYIEKTLD
ncbi:MAG: hypothetical protein RLZ75_747, partial [Pseudomonadota bacterium]